MTRKQAPCGRLIENLGKNPAVNLDYLFRGHGNPAKPEANAMPIFKRVLEGSPADAEEAATGDWQSLATRHYRPSRYWLRVQGDEPITKSLEQGVVAGDMILMETDRTAFPKPGNFVRQLCGVRFKKGILKLALVDCHPADRDTGAACIEAETFDLERKPEEFIRQYVIRHQPGRDPTVTTQRLVVPESGKPRHETFDDHDPNLPDIKFSQIVCMAVLVLRQPSPFWKE